MRRDNIILKTIEKIKIMPDTTQQRIYKKQQEILQEAVNEANDVFKSLKKITNALKNKQSNYLESILFECKGITNSFFDSLFFEYDKKLGELETLKTGFNCITLSNSFFNFLEGCKNKIYFNTYIKGKDGKLIIVGNYFIEFKVKRGKNVPKI